MTRYNHETQVKNRSPFRRAHARGGTAARIATWIIFVVVSALFFFFRFHGSNNLAGLLETRVDSQLVLWHGIASILVRNCPSSAETILIAISCMSAGLVTALLFASMRCLMLLFLRNTYHNAKARKVAAWAAGMTAAIAFVSHQPNWISVGWIRPEMFEVALVATTFTFLVLAMAYGRFRHLAIFAFLYGLFFFENADMFRLSPLFVIYTLFLLARTERAHLRYILSLGGLFILGAGIYLLLVDMEVGHPELAGDALPSFGSAVGHLMNNAADALHIRRGQIFFHHTMSATSSFWVTIVTHFKLSIQIWIHQSTSMLLIIMAIAPWAVAIELGAWTFGRTPRGSTILLHVILAIATMIGLSSTSLSPWGMIGPMMKAGTATKLPCFAYALMASTAGYLVGWGVIRSDGSIFSPAPVVEEPLDDDDDEDEFFFRLHVRTIFYFARILAWALFIFVVATAVMNFQPQIRAGIIQDQKENAIGTQMFKPRE